MPAESNFAITAATMRYLEQLYFDTYKKDASDLMSIAGFQLARVVSDNNPRSVCVVCGNGNNGGDGYAAACFLLEEGFTVTVVATEAPKTNAATQFYDKYKALGGKVVAPEEGIELIKQSDCIIDALFGYGFHGTAQGEALRLIQAINNSNALVVSADIPSGCDADFAEYTEAVKADITVVFGFLKAANVSYPAFEMCGKVILADIGLPLRIVEEAYKNIYIHIVNENTINNIRPIRKENSHKGSFGTVALYCGSANMPGAARLASIGALRNGVGLVKLIGDEKTTEPTKQNLAEIIFADLSDTPERADAYVIGCGFGRNRDKFLEKLLFQIEKSVCIDADGINFIADNIYVLNKISAEKVLTPHPAEMARLVGSDTSSVQQQRIRVAQNFAKQYNCVLVLKGARTVIATPRALFVNTSGSSVLAKGGSGDVLAGMIGAYLARGLDATIAAATAVYLHGAAGDRHKKLADVVLPSELLG